MPLAAALYPVLENYFMIKMLGEQIGEWKGKIAGQRVLDMDVPKMDK